MMKRSNKILVGCLALLLVLSVGYALFSDTITINGTASAKGSFDITATCETGISSKLGTAESLGSLYIEGGYQNDSCSVEDDAVSFKTEFLYPTARRNFTVKYTNTGTIDAYLNLSSLTKTRQICVADNFKGENQQCSSTDNLNGYFVNLYPMLANTGNGYALEDSEGNLLSEEEIMEFYVGNDTITLKPGYSGYFGFSSVLGHTNDNTFTTNEMFVNYAVTITYPFTQAQN